MREMGIIRKIFYVFLIISILFLFAGIYSGYTLANIERSRDVLISENPHSLLFNYSYNLTSYTLRIKIAIKNSGIYDYGIEKIAWACTLLNISNSSAKYPANSYQRYYPHNLYVKAGKTKVLEIVDNQTAKEWTGRNLLKNLLWQIKKYGKSNLVWQNAIFIDGYLDSFDHEQYKYNYRTWYLWRLPEVLIKYEGNTK